MATITKLFIVSELKALKENTSMITSGCPTCMTLKALQDHLNVLNTLDESVEDRDIANCVSRIINLKV